MTETRRMRTAGPVARAAYLGLALLAAPAALAPSQEPGGEARPDEPPGKEAPKAPRRVDVEPAARDDQIARRLERILRATGWFDEPRVRVEDGVVFLDGRTKEERYRKWAGDLAASTQDVAAVVNRIEVDAPSAWDFGPAVAGLRELGRDAAGSLPFFALAVAVLAAFALLARLATKATRRALRSRVGAPLLLEVVARGVGLLAFVLGLYLVLRVAGLTRLAVTVLGGTGLLGLIIGIAFRDITENFLASILLSIQQPFRKGDLIEVAGVLGYVQRLNVRTTVLMTLSGNQVEIPNATVYKSALRNYSSNPNRREDFAVGIGYGDGIADAQEAALAVLREHPAVLAEPEPWVLVESLGPATVNLRVYFWLDGGRHSWLKVRSSVIRLVKRAFQKQGISMPDEAREIVFPEAVPVRLLEGRPHPDGDGAPARGDEAGVTATEAEGELHSEAGQIERQAKQSRAPQGGEDLLRPAEGPQPQEGASK